MSHILPLVEHCEWWLMSDSHENWTVENTSWPMHWWSPQRSVAFPEASWGSILQSRGGGYLPQPRGSWLVAGTLENPSKHPSWVLGEVTKLSPWMKYKKVSAGNVLESRWSWNLPFWIRSAKRPRRSWPMKALSVRHGWGRGHLTVPCKAREDSRGGAA